MTPERVAVGAGALLVLAIGVLGYLAQHERRDPAPQGREGYRPGSWFFPRRVPREEFTARGWRYRQAANALTLLFWLAFAAWLVLRFAG